MSSMDSLPLITLQPASDAKNRWVALLLQAPAPLGGASLDRLLAGCGLAERLAGLACVAFVDPSSVDPALAAGWSRATRVVLCFPAAVALDAERDAMLAALGAAGFGLMIQGVPPAGARVFEGVRALAVACPGREVLAGLGEWLQQWPGPHLALGAEVDACPGFCKFHWLAGHVAPQAAKKETSGSRATLLKLLALVTSDADTPQIEAAIKCDPNLSYNLLKLVNSVAFGSSGKIASFAQAITVLGRRQLQRWLQLLLYTQPKGATVASPLLPRAALRARLMENLARRRAFTGEQLDRAFMVGMFSFLESLFSSPVEEILKPLNLNEEIGQALTTGDGPFGQLLAVVRLADIPPSPALAAGLADLGLCHEDWAADLIEAAGWAIQVGKEA